MLTIAERVARGAELLDRKIEGWRDWIEIGRLDVGTNCNCVIGQLFNDSGFSSGANMLEMTDDDLYTHGFEAKYGPGLTVEAITDEYEQLTTAWRTEIRNAPQPY